MLTPTQMSMVAIGAVLSYGLVSGAEFALVLAGPSAIVGYAAAALLAMVFIRCLAQMTAAHPLPGAFGAYAEHYLGPTAGFVVRCVYVVAVVLIIGTEAPWLSRVLGISAPWIPKDLIVGGALAGLGLVNLLGARWFARLEFALSAIKLLAMLVYLGLGCYYAFFADAPAFVANEALERGNWWVEEFPGVWRVFILATLGYVGLETLSVAAGETAAPAAAIRRKMRFTALLIIALSLMVVLVSSALAYRGVINIGVPPLWRMLSLAGVPGAQHVFSAIVVATVLSVLNSLLYCASRMLFSLARAGQAPKRLGEVRGASPRFAVAATVLLAVAVYAAFRWQPLPVGLVSTAIATAGLLVVWLAVLAAFVRFKRRGPARRALPAACAAIAGMGALLAIILSTWGIDIFQGTLRIGTPFVAGVWVLHLLLRWRQQRKCGRANRVSI